LKRKITQKQIARELDISISTVSKALKNSDELSQDTKDKVQAFAKFYNYKPNQFALSLRSQRSNIIGVILPGISHHLYASIFTGIEHYANKHDYNVIVSVSHESYDDEVAKIEMLANGHIDGFIVSLSKETINKNDLEHLIHVVNQGIPVVLFNRPTNQIDCDKVVVNNFTSAYKAVKKLIECRKKRIALIISDCHMNSSAINDKVEGYVQAHLDHGIPLNENLIVKISNTDVSDYTIKSFFGRENFDAVICVDEMSAIQSMRLAKEKGMEIPKDISFISFTDGILSQQAYPSLSVIAQDGEKMGEMAAMMLLERIESTNKEEIYRTEIIESMYIERESTLN